jgi:hypothetical protein
MRARFCDSLCTNSILKWQTNLRFFCRDAAAEIIQNLLKGVQEIDQLANPNTFDILKTLACNLYAPLSITLLALFS